MMTGTERELADQQRESEAVHKAEDRELAASYVHRLARQEGWPPEDLDDVLGALGVAVTPTPPV